MTTTPTGGVVDELDLGDGSSETGEPVALTHSVGITRGPHNGSVIETVSLAQRFVRASSPRVERNDDLAEGFSSISSALTSEPPANS
jgi:hypothetical protein